MRGHWTSQRTGVTYDRDRTDKFGNWEVVSGGTLSAASGAAVIIGSIGLVFAYVAASVAIVPVMVALYFARWPFLPALLLLVALLLFVLPAGRRLWASVLAAAGVSVVMIPGTLLSMWSLSHGSDNPYTWAASLPFMTVVCLGLAIGAAVKRIWPAAALFAALCVVSGLINLVSWVMYAARSEEVRSPPAVTSGFDNVLAVCALVVFCLIGRVLVAQIAVSIEKRRAMRCGEW